jgi:glutaminyl-peptide cyclotransferase
VAGSASLPTKLACVVAGVLTIVAGLPRADADPATPDVGGTVSMLRFTVLAEIAHDTTAWTEGLELDGPSLYESTGIVGESQLRELDPTTGVLRRAAALPPGDYGEGIAIVDTSIWQLTWRNGIAIEWDKATLTPVRQVPLSGEGWGLCRDGNRLVRSDGTDNLRFHDPADMAETGSVSVKRHDAPLAGLNGLECVDGQVWANVWPTDEIVRIDPTTGLVNAEVNLTGLLAGPRPSANVLNGIAHVQGQDFLLTGKHWPSMFRVRFDPAP